MTRGAMPQRIAVVRQFTRFFTRRIGILEERLLGSEFTLTEARILFEVASAEVVTATELLAVLSIDRGYMSRILKSLVVRGLIERTPSDVDARQMLLGLTEKGRGVFATLDDASRRAVSDLLQPLAESDQSDVIDAMRLIEGRLDQTVRNSTSHGVKLRPLGPGDIGWVVHRHGVLYAQEFGWDITFEGMVAKVASDFIERYDGQREAAWIAELNDKIVGSAFVVSQSKHVAKLRMVYVEPDARGVGVGQRLVDEAMLFAGGCGYRRMTLWTNDVLVSARRLYERSGFVLTASEPTHRFGKDLVSETWERSLVAP
jgi:DNA-binding MarR family transcriptional regulator/GNAT superfamily N-acetyltransferase